MPLMDQDGCEGCKKHVFRKNCAIISRGGCPRCLPPGTLLKACARCKFVLYCSKECQKGDWRRTHKNSCGVACNVRDLSKALGFEEEAKYKSFQAWCATAVSGHLGFAAVSALGLHKDWTRLNNYVFLINVKSSAVSNRRICEGIRSKSNDALNTQFAHTITSARCASMQEVHAFADRRFPDGAAGLEKSLAHCPGLMRILIINDGFPEPLDHYTAPVDIEPSNLLIIPYKPDWFKWLICMLGQGS